MADLDLFGAPVDTAPGLDECGMLDRLDRRYGRLNRNGPWVGLRWVGSRHVRLHPGAGGPGRVADFLAVDTWVSSGHALHGHEVKVSRSDWLTELRDPSKAEAFARFCSHWWLVVSDAGIVRDDLPVGWGLMVARGRGLSVVVDAVRRDPDPVPLHLLASFARSVAAQRPGPAAAHLGLEEAP